VDVWTAALTAPEAAQLYNGGTVLTSNYPDSGTESEGDWGDMVAGWHLTESSYADSTFTDFVSGDAYPGSPFGSWTWTAATPDPSVATYSFDTTSDNLGVNNFTATLNTSEDDDFGGATSAAAPVIVIGTTLPSEDDVTPADDIPSAGTPSPLTDGSNVLSIAAAGLTYVSGANGMPIVSYDASISTTYEYESLSSVTATLKLGGDTVGESFYAASDLTGDLSGDAEDGIFRFAVKYGENMESPPTALNTGQYSFTIDIAEMYGGDLSPTPSGYTVTQDVVNWTSSPFGASWNLDGLDQLAIDGSGNVLLFESDGTMAYYADSDGTYSSPASGPFAFTALAYSDGQYVLKGASGVEEVFNSTGELHYVIDNDDNTVTYNWSDEKLGSMVAANGNTTTFDYSGTLIESWTDFDDRTTALTYNEDDELTSITLPPPGDSEVQPVYNFADAADGGPMTSYINADGSQTLYAYRPADGTLETVTNPDFSTVTYQAAQALQFGTEDSGTPGSEDNPAYLVPSTTVRGVVTDEAGAPTICTFDAFADQTSVEDAAGDISVSTFNTYALVTAVIPPPVDNNGTLDNPATYYSYWTIGDAATNELETETAPDGSTQNWTYETYTTYGGPDEVVEYYENAVGDYTYYTYDTSGSPYVTADLIKTEQSATGSYEDDDGQSTNPQTIDDTTDPITTDVYTQSGGGTVAGLISSETNPDGFVSAFSYNTAGEQTAAYQGQTITSQEGNLGYTEGGDSSTWTFTDLAPNAAGSFEIYASASFGGSYSVEGIPPYGSDTSISLGASVGPPTSTLGSDWIDLGSALLPSGDTGISVTITGGESFPNRITLLEQTSTTVYNTAQDPVASWDAMGNLVATTFDGLDRPVGTASGQTLAAASNEATFQYLPQSPGMTRTYVIYGIGATPSDYFSFADTEHSPLTDAFDYSGASAASLLGSGWYEIGTVTLAAGDASSWLTVEFTGESGTYSHFTLLEQTGTTFYDPMNDVLEQSDGLNHVAVTSFNEVEEPVAAAQGQILPVSDGSVTLNNLPLAPGQPRTFEFYVNAEPDTSDPLSLTDTDDASIDPNEYFNGTPNTPLGSILGSGWYALETIVLPASDTSSSITLSIDRGTLVCLVQQTSTATYTGTGMTTDATDGDGNTTS
jgi:hypothetical protein